MQGLGKWVCPTGGLQNWACYDDGSGGAAGKHPGYENYSTDTDDQETASTSSAGDDDSGVSYDSPDYEDDSGVSIGSGTSSGGGESYQVQDTTTATSSSVVPWILGGAVLLGIVFFVSEA